MSAVIFIKASLINCVDMRNAERAQHLEDTIRAATPEIQSSTPERLPPWLIATMYSSHRPTFEL